MGLMKLSEFFPIGRSSFSELKIHTVDDKLKQKQSRGIECCIDEVVIEMFEANCF